MEVVKTLIRHVTRGFYDLKSILIMDALLIHSVLSDDDIFQLLGIQRKDLRALCAKLKEDHLVVE
jgi:transcription initiation factor TFIIE subunit alpha